MSFDIDNSWTILSPIEQSIKRKIEAIGCPLRDWNISINYGIKTGLNEAFIVSGEKKDELIAADPKSVEIIRPILRGRDIKRYGYDFADLWLISTFPSKGYNIDDYPAVKKHLLSFGIERLEQTGKKYVIDGKEIRARKKTSNKWFETQDSISYWDDFSKQKIIFQEIVRSPSFVLDNEKHFYCLDTSRIITGSNLEYLISVLNSKLFFYAIKTFYGGGGLGDSAIRMKHTFFCNFKVIKPSAEKLQFFKELYYSDISKLDNEISNFLYTNYRFTEKEIQVIEKSIKLP